VISTALRRLRPVNPDPSPWEPILAAASVDRGDQATGARVLCATNVGGHPVARVIDGLVAMALWLRGAEPELLLCDGALPACEACEYVLFRNPEAFARSGPQSRLCHSCFAAGSDYYRPLPLPIHRFGSVIEPGEHDSCLRKAEELSADECFSFEIDGLKLGEQTRASTLRFFGKADLSSEPPRLVDRVARRYAAAALLAALVAQRTLVLFEPDCMVAHHGVYVPQGVFGEVARREGVRVVNWGPSYRNTTAIFSHGDTYHHTFISEPVKLWDRPLGDDQEQALLDYLDARRRGRGDWTWVTPEAGLRPELQERGRLIEELALDASRPVFGLLTNVLWDAQLYYANRAFPDMLEWLWTTLDHFIAHPELQLIVRIHPHEVKHGNRQPVESEIRRRYAGLPESIKIIPHDHPFNTYVLMDLCQAVLIYGTKTGVELAPFGIPVIVAGDAWIRGKGFTYDAATREEYGELLERLPKIRRLDEHAVARARRYAYHYFFRRMVPFASLDPGGSIPPKLSVRTLADLQPGRDRGLDVVCEGILNGSPFVYDP